MCHSSAGCQGSKGSFHFPGHRRLNPRTALLGDTLVAALWRFMRLNTPPLGDVDSGDSGCYLGDGGEV